MAMPTLTTVTRSQGANQALKDGTVAPRTATLEFEEVPVLVRAFRRMVREHAYDVSEMALTTYLCAKEHGAGFTALPVFLVRGFHHGAIAVNTGAGIERPRDLEGKRVGVNRGYTVTTGVWARAILHDEHSVDLDAVTWAPSGDEHVTTYRPPANVQPLPEGSDLTDLVGGGELVGAVGTTIDHPDVAPLIDDPDAAAMASLQRTGLYPINHLVVVRDEVLEAHPGLAADLFEAFAEAKRRYVARLREGAIDEPDATDRLIWQVMDVLADPLPYGIAPNRQMIDRLLEHAVGQGILTELPDVESLFADGTHELAA